jgi:hypothetical protein
MHLEENLQAIATSSKEKGMDTVIVSTTSPELEAYWQERLLRGRGEVCKYGAQVLVVYEDWEGGAGNGLGTLYALQKAEAKAQQSHMGVLDRLRRGAAVAVYHTAGKGTRLAPLPGCEQNNKPGVKLPGLIKLGDRFEAMTILEAVIRQTALYAESRKGRVSVFWGDQIFIPTLPTVYTPTHHADILAKLGPMPDAASWQVGRLDRYGLVAVAANGDASQVEKISHAQARDLITKGVINVEGGIGVSLGSFSISADLTDALLTEFAQELEEKSGKMDTDPHFWMPLTLDAASYLDVMQTKGAGAEEAGMHYQRMQRFQERFCERQANKRILGCVDIGHGCLWWDYGQLLSYVTNNRKLTEDDPEAKAMRQFFQIEARQQVAELGDVDIDKASIILNCRIENGRIRNSVLIGVEAEELYIDNTILVHTKLQSLTGNNVLLYNVASSDPLVMDPDRVYAEVVVRDTRYRFITTLGRDGGADWYICLPENPMSYDELHKRIAREGRGQQPCENPQRDPAASSEAS